MLPEEIKIELLDELRKSWQIKTNNCAVFISATLKDNITELRDLIFNKVKEQYEIRYPYRTNFF